MPPYPEWFVSLRELPQPRALALTAVVSLVAVADWLPANRYVDPDTAEFTLSMAIGLSALAMAAADRLSPDRLSVWRNRLLAGGLAVLLAAAAAEAGTRYVFRAVTTTADNGGYFSRRWNRQIAGQTNPYGYRERPFSLVKPPGTYRIAVIGDSFTFGNGLPTEQRYSALLERWLPDRFEVLNFGEPGHNSTEHKLTLEGRVRPTRPDFVLLQWFVNDVEGATTVGRPHFLPLMPRSVLQHWLSRHSALYAVAGLRWMEWQVRIGLVPSYAEYLNARASDPRGTDARRERSLLHDLVAAAHGGGAGFGMVLFPDAGYDLDARYPFGYLHQRVLDACREEQISCVDLRADFAKVKDRRTLWVNPLDHHPSARANQIAALRILEVFEPDWTR